MSRIQENNYYANNNYNGPVTGTEKIKIKSDANGVVTQEKSSYYNPNTGVSESYKIKTKAERSRSRSRSNSSERRRRDLEYRNGYQQMPVNSAPLYSQPMAAYNQSMPVYNQSMPGNYGPSYPGSNGIYNPNDAHTHEKTTIKTTDNSYKVQEKLSYVNPVTGLEENAKITHKVRGDRSKSHGKSKTTYDYKADGQEVVVKEKHR